MTSAGHHIPKFFFSEGYPRSAHEATPESSQTSTMSGSRLALPPHLEHFSSIESTPDLWRSNFFGVLIARLSSSLRDPITVLVWQLWQRQTGMGAPQYL